VEDLPALFGNSMAKAGSHLLAQYLEGLTVISSLLFLDPFPIRTITAEGRRLEPEQVIGQLRGLRPGEIRWGYLPGRPEYVHAVLDGNRLAYFLMRDPRDKVISHILYALEIHEGHAMRRFYADLPDMEARIDHTIRGVPGMVQDIRSSYESYLGWLDQPRSLCISFEDLVEHRESALLRMLAHVENAGVELLTDRPQALNVLNRVMAPARSPTYRAGRPGNWQQYFTESNKRAFKEVAGDLLVRLGYEQGADW
jgi:hypothetical protein